jgi:hypothetical protein
VFGKYLIAGFSCLIAIGCAVPSHPTAPGFLEGHLTIVSLKEVELSGADPSKGVAHNYAEYPLIVWSKDGQQEIARVTADERGNFRVALPPGEYVLDAVGRAPGRIRAKPKEFTVISNQTVRADFELDTGIR